ncbi:MAG TPA: NADH:flavin oxidoreductase/NADH oxidase family protein [Nocardioidaceae bacterium]|nr:NADH:flavin oxidoreductase/NADH oxidase family protein [Nocardioidaceae bacterium]
MIDAPIELPCGATLPNRLAKAALSEQLGDARHAPSDQLIRLYQRWSNSGAGLLITGNVMVDRNAIGEPANVVVEGRRDLDRLRRWARSAKAGGATVIVQVNHPGRQVPVNVSRRPVAPSAIPMKGMMGAFATPRALTVKEIHEIQDRFARTSKVLVAAGFDGVQLHGAHGYLISQFLSPLANQRTDEYGGDPVNRRRFLMELVEKTREAIGPDKILSVKINSADFQRGGFTEDESLDVARELDRAGIDLLEISGGTYEQAAMMGVVRRESTRQREAYFLDFAERLRSEVALPLMVTGGFRTRVGMDEALDSGAVDVIGLGRPLAVQPEAPCQLLSGEVKSLDALTEKRVGVRKLDALAETVWYTTQMWRMGRGKDPATTRPAALGVSHYFLGGVAYSVRKKVS